MLPAGQTYLASFAVSWTAPDGTSPNATSPLWLTISDARIGTTDLLYQTTATGVQPVTGTLAAGKATFSFTVDPGFVVAAPAAVTPPAPIAELPRTGSQHRDRALFATGLAVLGLALRRTSRRSRSTG
jgi:hypothetical protein